METYKMASKLRMMYFLNLICEAEIFFAAIQENVTEELNEEILFYEDFNQKAY